LLLWCWQQESLSLLSERSWGIVAGHSDLPSFLYSTIASPVFASSVSAQKAGVFAKPICV